MNASRQFPSALLAAAVAAWMAACGGGAAEPPGSAPPAIAESPSQGAVHGKEPWTLERGGWTFTLKPLAAYTIHGRVLSSETYWSGWQSELSPLDLALGWGDLVTSGAWTKVEWSQSNRWYWYRWPGDFGHDERYIIRHSANIHVLPASPAVEDGAESVSEGDDVELEGWLVRVDGRKGGRTVWWESSLTRDDTGDGSCEVMWVTKIRANGRVWR